MKHVKRIALLLIGFVPLLSFGYYVSHLMRTVYYYVIGPLFLFGVAVVAAWFIFGMISIKLTGSRKEALLFLNAPAAVVLVLILVQEYIFRAMWANQAGFATQMFYLPLVRFGSVISGIVPRFILPVLNMSIVCGVAFFCLLGASCLGRMSAERIGLAIAERRT